MTAYNNSILTWCPVSDIEYFYVIFCENIRTLLLLLNQTSSLDHSYLSFGHSICFQQWPNLFFILTALKNLSHIKYFTYIIFLSHLEVCWAVETITQLRYLPLSLKTKFGRKLVLNAAKCSLHFRCQATCPGEWVPEPLYKIMMVALSGSGSLPLWMCHHDVHWDKKMKQCPVLSSKKGVADYKFL
jgi:hypothetical protein